MKRFTTTLSVCVIASLLLAGCGKKKSTQPLETTEPETAAPVAAEESAKAEEPATESSDTAVSSEEASAPAAAGSLALTRITPEGKQFAITLNNSIVIHQAEVKSGQYGKFLGLPERRSADGKFWDHVYIQKEAGAQLAAQLESNKPAATGEGLEVTAVKLKLVNKPGDKLKAFVEFFELNGGAVKLYSWVLRDGTKGLYISGPSEKVGDEYQDLVHAANKEFYEKLKTAALAEYKNQGGKVN